MTRTLDLTSLRRQPKAGISSYRRSIVERQVREHKAHPVLPQPEDVARWQSVADLLVTGAPSGQLAPYLSKVLPGTTPAGVELALRLVDNDRTSKRGTKHLPRSKGRGPVERAQAQRELYFRAAYVGSAAQRLSDALRAGKTPVEAVRSERPWWKAHEQARRNRQQAAGVVNGMLAWQSGTKMGWYAHHDDLVTPECRLADGKNFDALQPPLIGYPGMPHGGTCRCVPGPAHPGAGTVDQATKHLLVGG